MRIKALVSFAGILTMHKGEELEHDNPVVLQDLLQAGYVEEIKRPPPKGTKKTILEEVLPDEG